MEHRLDAAEPARLDAVQEIVLVEIVGDLQVGEIGDLVAIGQVVDDEDVAHGPSALSAAMMLEPIMPAPPVTMIMKASGSFSEFRPL